jgi:hypothetical protein
MNKFYTGVGSRKTPSGILLLMQNIAAKLNKLNWTLRTGNARGADEAFLIGATLEGPPPSECYSPQDLGPDTASAKACQMAKRIHPAWDRCDEYARALHARNCFQVLGRNLDSPSKFLICWTPNGAPIGGTRTAIMLARENEIPVYNLAREGIRLRLETFAYAEKSCECPF